MNAQAQRMIAAVAIAGCMVLAPQVATAAAQRRLSHPTAATLIPAY
jgi:hypothetical protein